MKIKLAILRHAIRTAEKRKIKMLPYRQVRTVLIITDQTDTEPLTRQLSDDGKKVTVVPTPTNKETNLLGYPKGSICSELAAQHYDLLIDLQQQPTIAGYYLILNANASLKAGRRNDFDLLDFMVDMPVSDSPQPLLEQILHYLKTINNTK